MQKSVKHVNGVSSLIALLFVVAMTFSGGAFMASAKPAVNGVRNELDSAPCTPGVGQCVSISCTSGGQAVPCLDSNEQPITSCIWPDLTVTVNGCQTTPTGSTNNPPGNPDIPSDIKGNWKGSAITTAGGTGSTPMEIAICPQDCPGLTGSAFHGYLAFNGAPLQQGGPTIDGTLTGSGVINFKGSLARCQYSGNVGSLHKQMGGTWGDCTDGSGRSGTFTLNKE